MRSGAVIAAEVAFRGVKHDYAGSPSLKGIDLNVKPGEVICLLGPSGCGKSTLLRLTAGLEALSGGSIAINGREMSVPGKTVPAEKRGVGMMFQDYALFPHLDVLANVMFGLRDLGREDAKRVALLALSRVGLEDRASAYPHALSGGEQQRVALARAIVPRPAVLLMDEPFSGLDKRLRDSVREETMGVLRETRATCVLVTHDPEEAMRVADRIVLMRDGRIVQAGTADELYRAPVDIEAARFFAEINEVEGDVQGGQAVTPIGSFAAPGMNDGELARVCIRQQGIEFAALAPAPGKNAPHTHGLAGRIIERRYLGEVDVVDLAVNGLEGLLTARVRHCVELGPGDDVTVTIDPSEVLIFSANT